ncbi:MAG TPA: tetratricopeptide repeat protein [Steroidobacteraceae bacterium]|nr:tetratricopeptide repeat protein [Steroidobacteraceae bacterium]
MRLARLPLVVVCCALAVVLAGCASQPVNGKSPDSAEQNTDANSHLMVAEIALQRGDYNAAATEYVAAARLASDPTLAQRATEVAFGNGQMTAAVEGARRWLELDPENVAAHRYLAVAALRLHQLDESLRHFEPVLAAAYASPAAGFMDLSSILTEEDNVYGVLRVTQGLAERHQKVAEAHYAIAVAALRGYHYELAVDSCRKALALDPTFADAEELLARALVVNGQNAEGLELARKRVQAANDTDSRLELTLLLSAANEEEAARKELNALLEIPEARPEALRTLAGLDLAAGKYDEATTRFNQLLEAGRYVALSFYSLGLIHERRRDPMRAVRYYSRVASGPYANDAQLRAARLLASSGARDQAIQLLDSYTTDHPESAVEIAIGRAQLLAEEGDAENALGILDDMAVRYPDNVSLQYARSVTLDRLDQVDGAIATLRALLAKRPKDPVTMNALGYTLADHNRDLREAHNLVRAALEMSPDSAAVQDSMGWTLHRMGEQRDALKWLTKAYAVEKDAEIAAHLGETLWDLGQRTQARAIWDEALARDPDHRYLLNTLRRYPE